MDRPGLDRDHHVHALTGLARINRISGSAKILWPQIRQLILDDRSRPIRLLDIACGGGDVPISLAEMARSVGFPLEIEACDVSPVAIEHSEKMAIQKGVRIRFFGCNVLESELPTGFDIVTCSLFLHHLSETEAVELLRKMVDVSRQLVLVHDLIRSPLGLMLAYIGSRLLTFSEVVRTDGPLSVRAAFTIEEVDRLVRQAGSKGASIQRRWPKRFLLTSKKT